MSSPTSSGTDQNCTGNPLHQFMDQLFKYITGQHVSQTKCCNLIKQNKDHLNINGDFSFSNKRHVWMSYMSSSLPRQEAGFCTNVNCKHNKVLFVDIDDDADADASENPTCPFHSHYTVTKLLERVSNTFALPVATVKIVGDWCNVYLDRRKCLEKYLYKVLDNDNENRVVGQGYARLTRKSIKITSDCQLLTVDSDNSLQSVTDYRLKLLQSVVKNLINESDCFTLCQDETETSKIPIHVHLTTKSSTVVRDNSMKVMSGIVTDPKNGNKLASMTSEEYIK